MCSFIVPMKLIACSSARLWTHMPMHTISGLYGILLKPEGGMTPCPIYPYGGRIRRRPYPRCTLYGLSVTDLPHRRLTRQCPADYACGSICTNIVFFSDSAIAYSPFRFSTSLKSLPTPHTRDPPRFQPLRITRIYNIIQSNHDNLRTSPHKAGAKPRNMRMDTAG